ncbi:MAG: polymer-forming cytoskeletal protein [Chitinophagaceae bacterium]|nr:polymer-forming cytoskeletal protein [Anaerolineae bacterium]
MEVLSRYIIMEMALMSFFSNRRQTDPEPISRPIERAAITPTPALPAPSPTGFESVLGAHCVMEGKLESHANIRLDGIFTGSLDIFGNVLVGETAKITADVNAKNISIAGSVKGNVHGQKVQLLQTGRVVGDIHAVSLTMEEGAYLDGKISMVQESKDDEAETVASAEPAFLDEVTDDESSDTDNDEASNRF